MKLLTKIAYQRRVLNIYAAVPATTSPAWRPRRPGLRVEPTPGVAHDHDNKTGTAEEPKQ